MKKNKTEKGITLVALIITIIVLLILTVVAIGIVRGDGILFHAKDAARKYADEAEKENSTLQGYMDIMIAQTVGAPIPKGFQYVEGTKADGVVIEREDKSQFVWIPVEDINDMVICQAADRTDETHIIDPTTLKCSVCGEATKLAGRSYAKSAESGETFDARSNNQKYIANKNLREPDVIKEDTNNASSVLEENYSSFADQLQAEFNEMVKSVAKYKGFYVGRYETSLDENGKAQSIYGATSASAAENSANTWYGLYQKQKEYSTESVQGSMIWGSQYDAMMRWMGDIVKTSIGDNRNTKTTTGTCETDVIKKVYDLYGNKYEWTLEANTDTRVYRGGANGSGFSPSYRFSYLPSSKFSYVGSRLTLYIK